MHRILRLIHEVQPIESIDIKTRHYVRRGRDIHTSSLEILGEGGFDIPTIVRNLRTKDFSVVRKPGSRDGFFGSDHFIIRKGNSTFDLANAYNRTAVLHLSERQQTSPEKLAMLRRTARSFFSRKA